LTTAEETFMESFLGAVKRPREVVAEAFEIFYAVDFPTMFDRISPRPAAIQLLDWLFANDYTVVVATNPVTPESAIHQRMAWGQIPITRYPFALVTTLETMHFAKPNPEYFDEVIARIGAKPEETLLVGDHWERDVVGAIAAGLNTFWITNEKTPPNNQAINPDGTGTIEVFADLVLSRRLDELQSQPRTRTALLHQLAAMPAAIDTLLREYPVDAIERKPSDSEWSVQDVISHLGCHELSEDRLWLETILSEENPFISATHSLQTRTPRPKPAAEELRAFAELRAETVAWLKTLPDGAWTRRARHSIFGPTYFEEMIGFMVEHDRTHLHQMRVALERVHSNQPRLGG
jgi:FMN phosphatase YigB (HAD superfamily)